MATRRVLTVLCTVFALLSVAAAVAVAVSTTYNGRILPRTFLAGAPYGSQKTASVPEQVAVEVANVANEPISFSLDESQSSLTPAELGVTISTEETISQLVVPIDQWAWLTTDYWQQFFRRKDAKFAYQVDVEKLKTSLDEKFAANQLAEDARVVIENNTLVVKPSKEGRSVNLAEVRASLDDYLAGRGQTINVNYQATPPIVTTAAAEKTKAEIERKMTRPLYLKTEDGSGFTISLVDQYNLISYTAAEGELNWTIDSAKLKDYLNAHVGKKINLKMVQKVVQSNDGAIITEGRDGREVNVTTLTKSILAAYDDGSGSKEAPIVIPVAVIAFTERKVDPLYFTDRFDGLYIEINLKVQRVYIIKDRVKTAEYLISSGKRGTPTPVGQFYILNKHPLAQSRLFPGIWMEKWNALTTTPGSAAGYDGYGLHRVPCFNRECTVREPSSNLGRPVSHGCVRIANEGADWIYDNAPVGTPVNIHY